MKKFLILFIAIFALCSSPIYSQNEFPFVESLMLFNLEIGSLHIQMDKHGNTWLEHDNNQYSKNSNGKYYRYYIKTGKHLLLKLSNNEIITLKCHHVCTEFRGYGVVTDILYEKHDKLSYFKLTDEQINKLKQFNIIKIRCEFKYNTLIDATFENDGISLSKSFENIENKYNKLKNKNKNNDNLYNF